ncbi:MarR family winged helix-turn-helix transcriptional regulator [Paractinoplanes toevensis]|uniref:Transcriptional regulator, MarR family protein n=1 Tax=Paractinoplanes toevensis TaxID=571911 RepID=A0A919TDD7_9ACTN|nr:MarR family transcriptional regulator [Actinoplanes toevensis]GIM93358.1 putative transcriptional regulator, MarR family protein [Actinoplanes toevensis]
MDRLPSWLLNQNAAYAGRLVSDGFSAAGARGYHYRVLTSLDVDGPTTQANLGRRTGIYPSDIVATINELQANGYVMRSLDKTDKRRNLVSITPAGRKRAKELTKTVATIQDALLEPLDETERDELTRLLVKLHEHHRQGFPPLPSM